MKKSLYLFILATVILLSGCSKKDQMTNFIPTMSPEESEESDTQDISPTQTADNTDVTTTPKEIHIGQTVTKYVKLSEYDDVLNVRPNPSTDQEPVGFLVHAEKIEVAEIKDGWASFVYNGQICYVNASFLVDERPAYLTPPAPSPTPKASATPKATPTPTPDPNEEPPEI